MINITSAIILTILASFLWSITNHIDKFLINGIDKNASNIKTLLVFSTFVAGIIFTPIWFILSKFSVSINQLSFFCVIFASVIYLLATFLYFKALEKNDASIIAVMFQLIPVFSYLLALLFFKETLTIKQIIGSLIIISSAVIISINFNERNNKKKFEALILMKI